MKMIGLLITGIVLLIILPTAYFCFSKISDRQNNHKTAVAAAVVFVLVVLITAVGAANLYTYMINSEESIVAQRYVHQLIIHAHDEDTESLKAATRLYAYEIEELETLLEDVKVLGLSRNSKMMVSESRWTDEEGIRYLYLIVDEKSGFEIGLKQQKRFWDVYDIELLDHVALNRAMKGGRFLPIR